MAFKNEDEFRSWICAEIKILLPDGWRVIKGKNIADILLSSKDEETPFLLFLEVKYHKKNHRRIPIGGKGGDGYQPEYLLNTIPYLEKYMRWIVGDEELESCLILTNNEVREYACGGIALGKHNNLQSSIFRKEKARLVPIEKLPEAIVEWAGQL